MENASKALLIAGAILIVILLIGVGMMVFNSSQGLFTAAGRTMSTKEKDMFNTQFTKYIGNQNGSSVKGLLSEIISNNNGGDDVQKVNVNDQNVDTTSSLPGGTPIISAATYKVEITTEDYTDGLVSNIQIEKIN